MMAYSASYWNFALRPIVAPNAHSSVVVALVVPFALAIVEQYVEEDQED